MGAIFYIIGNSDGIPHNAKNALRAYYNSTLAAEASAVFSLELGMAATFDCRMVPLPNSERVEDYFRWRQEDANRNALNSHCYWMLRKEGMSVNNATSELKCKGVAYKNELLFSRGINYDNLPSWQKRGVGMYYQNEQKQGYNPVTRETTSYTRRSLHLEMELPIGQEYSRLIAAIIEDSNKEDKR